MEKIYFDNLRNNFSTGLFILSALCLIFGIFELIEFSNSDIHGNLRKTGFLLQALYFSKMFWYKNYVQWNKLGAVIRINSIFGKSIKFVDVRSTEINNKILTVTKTSGEKITFNLKQISESDIQKFNEVIVNNTIAISI